MRSFIVSGLTASLVCLTLLGGTAAAQQDPLTTLLDSPVKAEREEYRAGPTLFCTRPLPGTAALFGVDTADGAAPTKSFVADQLFAPFRVWELDENGTLVQTWSTVFAGTTQTGIAVPNAGPGAGYWVLNPGSGTADLHRFGSGAPAGIRVPLPAGGRFPGPLVIDDHQPGEIGCFQDIGLDLISCIDMSAGGAFLCSYANIDNTGSGAFGNGIGDAADRRPAAGPRW